MPRLSRVYKQSAVHAAVLKAVQSLGYSNPTSEQIRVVEAFERVKMCSCHFPQVVEKRLFMLGV